MTFIQEIDNRNKFDIAVLYSMVKKVLTCKKNKSGRCSHPDGMPWQISLYTVPASPLKLRWSPKSQELHWPFLDSIVQCSIPVVLEASIHYNPQPQNHTRILWDCGMTHWASQSNATVFAKRPSSKHSACRKEHAAWLSESKASASALWDFSCLMNRHAQAFLEGRVFDVTSGGLALKYWQLHLHLLTARVFELKSNPSQPMFRNSRKCSSIQVVNATMVGIRHHQACRKECFITSVFDFMVCSQEGIIVLAGLAGTLFFLHSMWLNNGILAVSYHSQQRGILGAFCF